MTGMGRTTLEKFEMPMNAVYRTVGGRILAQSKAGVSTEYLIAPLGSVIGTSTSVDVVSPGAPGKIQVCNTSPETYREIGAPIRWGNLVLFNLLHEIGRGCGYGHQTQVKNSECNDAFACYLHKWRSAFC